MATDDATLLLKIKTKGKATIGKIGDSLKKLAKVGAAAFAAIGGVATAAIVQYKKQEAAVNSLNQALIQQGIFTRSLSNEYKENAKELEKLTGVSQDQILSAQSLLQSYLGQEKVSKELTLATLDLAASQKIDLKSAADQIGKSIGTAENAMKTYGIELDITGSKSDKIAGIIEGVSDKWAGQAAAQVEGLGSLTLLQLAANNFLLVIGQRLAPIVVFVTKKLITLAEALQKDERVIKSLTGTVKTLTKFMFGLGAVVQILGQIIGSFFAAFSAFFSNIIDNKFKTAIESVKIVFGETLDDVVGIYNNFNKNLSDVDEEFASAAERRRQEELNKERRAREQRLFLIKQNNNNIRTLQQKLGVDVLKEIQNTEEAKRILRDIANKDELAQLQAWHALLQKEWLKRKNIQTTELTQTQQNERAIADFMAGIGVKWTADSDKTLTDLGQLQQSKFGAINTIGKGAALASISIDTAKGAMSAFAFGSSIGGPVVGGPLAAGVILFGAEKAAQVSGIQLQEGGVVRATPGGVPAIIGEGGQDELVIPLERDDSLGTTINLTVMGGFLGTDRQAKEFAVAVDQELFKLRKANQSLSFDSGII